MREESNSRPFDKAFVHKLLKLASISKEELPSLLNVDKRTIQRWLSPHIKTQPQTDNYLELRELLNERLKDSGHWDGPPLAKLAPPDIHISNWQPPLWLPSPNLDGSPLYFANRTPSDFIGREDELSELWSFADNDSFLSWYLITGRPGIGKSRLALEFCLQISDTWNCGFLRRSRTDDSWHNWEPDRPTFIVVDYLASGRQAERVSNAIVDLHSHVIRFKHPVRFLLLELTDAGPWFERFKCTASYTDRRPILETEYNSPYRMSLLSASDSKKFLETYLHERSEVEHHISEIDDELADATPLVLTLMADAIADESADTTDRSTSLVHDVVERNEARWRHRLGDSFERYANLLVLSVLTRGLSLDDYENLFVDDESRNISRLLPTSVELDLDAYTSMCGGHSYSADELPFLEPDSLAVELVRKRLESSKTLTARHTREILGWAWKEYPDRAIAFLADAFLSFRQPSFVDVFLELPIDEHPVTWWEMAPYFITLSELEHGEAIHARLLECAPASDDAQVKITFSLRAAAASFALSGVRAAAGDPATAHDEYLDAWNKVHPFLAQWDPVERTVTTTLPPRYYCDAARHIATACEHQQLADLPLTILETLVHSLAVTRNNKKIVETIASVASFYIYSTHQKKGDLAQATRAYRHLRTTVISTPFFGGIVQVFAEAANYYIALCCDNGEFNRALRAYTTLAQLSSAYMFKGPTRAWFIETARQLFECASKTAKPKKWALRITGLVLQPVPVDTDDVSVVTSYAQFIEMLATNSERHVMKEEGCNIWLHHLQRVCAECPSHEAELSPILKTAAIGVLGGQATASAEEARSLYEFVQQNFEDQPTLRLVAQFLYAQELRAHGRPRDASAEATKFLKAFKQTSHTEVSNAPELIRIAQQIIDGPQNEPGRRKKRPTPKAARKRKKRRKG